MSRPVMSVSLVIGRNCAMESYAIRSALEYFGVRVNMHWLGRPNDLIDLLSGETLDNGVDYLLLNFHGDEGKFCMPELGEEFYEQDEPRGLLFGAQEVKQYAQLNGVKVIAAGCTLGEDQLANAFLASGCKSYIAPDGYIDGNANLMFILRFMYELINNEKTEEEAFQLARTDEETSLYKLYQSKK